MKDTDPPPAGLVHRFPGPDMEAPERLPLAGGEACVFSTRAPGKETPSQDAAGVVCAGEEICLLVVADGVGGMQAGDVAAQCAVREMERAVTALGPQESLREAVLNGIEAANAAIQASGTGGGTTIAVVEIQGRSIRPYHVGDATVLVLGQRGRVKLQTVSHSPVGYAIESGLLDEGEAIHHEDRHVISNAVGAEGMRIEVGASLELAARDTVVVASDGLFDNLYVEEIVECVRKGPLEAAADALARRTLERMGNVREGVPSKPDDLTFVLYRPAPPRRRPS